MILRRERLRAHRPVVGHDETARRLAPRAVTTLFMDRDQIRRLARRQHGRQRQRARQAPDLIAVHEKGSDGTWRETARGFVVPDDWPVRAQAFAAQDH
ncbi:hypothetical protein A8D69_35380 [Burkholderia cenocepacia]|nr:hypothetical protein A8D69_35380 [Burkholderia cenocepacia]